MNLVTTDLFIFSLNFQDTKRICSKNIYMGKGRKDLARDFFTVQEWYESVTLRAEVKQHLSERNKE